MPFCHLHLKAKKPRPGYPVNPTTFGERLKKWRLDRGLRQADVAKQLGVDPMTIVNWERGRTKPRRKARIRIIEFLSYTLNSQ
ncbi:MAG: helix-turn-helix transcriptional regulator [Planctomycetes bacterium]|nr:helix-turn-helix transcriptional regulator [Planctomycetota bacterium]